MHLRDQDHWFLAEGDCGQSLRQDWFVRASIYVHTALGHRRYERCRKVLDCFARSGANGEPRNAGAAIPIRGATLISLAQQGAEIERRRQVTRMGAVVAASDPPIRGQREGDGVEAAQTPARHRPCDSTELRERFRTGTEFNRNHARLFVAHGSPESRQDGRLFTGLHVLAEIGHGSRWQP